MDRLRRYSSYIDNRGSWLYQSRRAWCHVGLCLQLGLAFVFVAPARATEQADLTSLSIEDLLDVEITSVSKRSERLVESAAAVYAISGEDIRRLGITTIPEALRLVPGVEVGQINQNAWAVSARGFNSRFARSLLVLIDGRTVYTPIFSGVFWDAQDTLLEDIDRIEVIRGPGATLWGSNAVNGIINIITKKASETQGTMVSTTVGDQGDYIVSARHGAQIGDASFRGYVKRRSFEEGASETDVSDDWSDLRGGFRVDWNTDDDRDQIMLQADAYNATVGSVETLFSYAAPHTFLQDLDSDSEGVSIVGSWSRRVSNKSGLSLQAYFDYAARELIGGGMDTKTLDVEYQQNWEFTEDDQITWGLGLRSSWIEQDNAMAFSFLKNEEQTNRYNAFLQGEFGFFDNALRLITGAKVEHNEYTGWEVQPTVRLAYTHDHYTFWTSVSRAVRTPSYAETNLAMLCVDILPPMSTLNPTSMPLDIFVAGNSELKSENVLAYEVGLRGTLFSDVSFDLAAYYNTYDDVVSSTNIPTPFFIMDPVPHLAVPLLLGNDEEIETYGFEAALRWRVNDKVQFDATYSYIDDDIDGVDVGAAEGGLGAQGSPTHQVGLVAHINITPDLSFDIWSRYVDEIEGLGIDEYYDLDLRVAWEIIDGVELAVTGQNLIEEQRTEHVSSFIRTAGTDVERAVFGSVRFDF